jgi:hypothetical protein
VGAVLANNNEPRFQPIFASLVFDTWATRSHRIEEANKSGGGESPWHAARWAVSDGAVDE